MVGSANPHRASAFAYSCPTNVGCCVSVWKRWGKVAPPYIAAQTCLDHCSPCVREYCAKRTSLRVWSASTRRKHTRQMSHDQQWSFVSEAQQMIPEKLQSASPEPPTENRWLLHRSTVRLTLSVVKKKKESNCLTAGFERVSRKMHSRSTEFLVDFTLSQCMHIKDYLNLRCIPESTGSKIK